MDYTKPLGITGGVVRDKGEALEVAQRINGHRMRPWWITAWNLRDRTECVACHRRLESTPGESSDFYYSGPALTERCDKAG